LAIGDIVQMQSLVLNGPFYITMMEKIKGDRCGNVEVCVLEDTKSGSQHSDGEKEVFRFDDFNVQNVDTYYLKPMF